MNTEQPILKQAPTLCAVALAASLAFSGGPVLAAGNQPARLRVAVALVDEVVQSLLPVILAELPGRADPGHPATILTEMRYCGVSEKGAGRFRAVLRQGGTGVGAPVFLPGRDVCRPSLNDLAKRAEPKIAEGVAIADLEATWKSWELKVVLLRSIVLGSPRSGRIPELEASRVLWTVTTSDLRIASIGGEPILVHGAPWFAPATIEIAVFLGERASATPVPAGRKGVTALAGEANLAADVPLSFVNQALRQLTAPQPLAIPVDSDTVDLDKLSATQEGTGLTIRGDASPRSMRETVHVTVFVDGEDLRVSSVRAEGQGDDCAGLGAVARMACNLRGSARGVVAEALGAALTQRFQGQLVRELAGQQAFRFAVGGQTLEVRGDWLHLGFGTGSLSGLARVGTGGSGNEHDSTR